MKIHDVIQGTPEWHALRCGVITASAIEAMLSPTLKIADNATSRAYLADLLAQRITGHTAQQYVSADMMRGLEDEPIARALYSERYAPVTEVGFVTREVADGVTIGCSPDGLVGDDGGIEIKSRQPKIQIRTILECRVPSENMIQVQTNLLVTGRAWWDYVSYSAGLPLVVIRVTPDPDTHAAIIEAATMAEMRLRADRKGYEAACAACNWKPTPRSEIEI